MTVNPYHLAFTSILLVSIAQLLMKYAMINLNVEIADIVIGLEFLSTYWQPVLLPLFIGMACYGLSVLCWISALSAIPLSIAYPLLSLSYVLVNIGVWVFPIYNEQLNLTRVIGILLILIGVLFVARQSQDLG